MFSDYQLESPPPPSRFRRPWSPDPYDPLPSSSNMQHILYEPHAFVAGHYTSERRREPSDVSVEALDLADYARTLNPNQQYHLSQHPPFQPYDAYPPSPQSSRPLARTDSLSPPSLVSASASSSHSHSFSPRSPVRRPFSLPPPSSFPTSLHSHPATAQYPAREPQIASPESEIDIAQFPSFARGWYGQERSGPAPYQAISPSASLNARVSDDLQKKSPFDPAYTFERDTFRDPYSSPPPTYPYGSSYGSNSRYSRDGGLVPWGADPPDGDHPVDPETKEERMRMLEREFGGKGGTAKGEGDPETMVGSVDHRGRLITEGPKKRLAVRCVQALLALTASVSSIYAALIIKPPSPAPPANKLPAYLLYVLSVSTFLGCTFLFLIYPCCCGARKPKDAPYTQGPGGMMVLPVQGMPDGEPKKGKKGKGGPPGQGVQVNLIVDPTMFGRDAERGRDDDVEDDEDDASEALPGSFAGSSSTGRRKRFPRRRGIFAGLAMEAQWQKARKVLKWNTTVDVFGMLLWGMEFVVILLGKRCPVGGFEGWCDAYNLATAAACFLCLAFGLSVFFDVKDLHASRMSPRTRT
ncbi:hypothetical protein PYCCODRAFT_1448777 [Trametes coccinea BRFM310]|uniref:Uncharacterized protein n=1 Tax=Trametes coccinea (strain BRFM310) TaxID=1353009 RepID=A0A1Y2J6R2_TRAC3|nr:hypothetical protein PYCCODRAFT_1448777 [Trametes coccinea BRFM310]